ncbi:MAG: hypothetical protein EXQ88_03860 [Alphaproteobacteria bacterium]|nr:hypothetical protein [Alphaproteobacteria bacterium]
MGGQGMTRAQQALRSGLAVVVASSCLGLGLAASAAEVTFQRLLDAQNEPQNWLLTHGNYSSHANSSLNQINRSNVANLKVKFLHSIGGMKTLTANAAPPPAQSTPAVVDGFMYVHNGWGEVQKIDVRSGTRARTLWINDPRQEKPGSYTRGTKAMLGNFIYNNTTDMRLIKIDTNSGEAAYDVIVAAPPPHPQDQLSSAGSLAIKNMILTGQSTGGGRRGWLAAFRPEDGKELWRFYSTPAPGEFGHETWKDTWNAWAMGGGGVWTTPSYDPDTNLVIYGTGDIIPWGDPTFRPGDNLFAVTTLALHADTGKLAWHFQQVPNDTFDGDNVSPKLLYSIPGADGMTMRKVMGNFIRGGFYTTLDRATGQFINAEPFTFVNWTAGIDPKTGKPVEYDSKKNIQAYAKSIVIGNPAHSANTCPNFSGGPTYFPPTFDSRRMIAYAMMSDGCYSQENEKVAEKVDQRGRGPGNLSKSTLDAQPIGRIVAVDVRTGKKVRQNAFEQPGGSGLLGTAGDLIFMGHVTGMFTAYDKDTLSELWAFDTGAPIRAAPITYAFDGKQYVAVVSGGAKTTSPFDPTLGLLQQNSQVIVFGL